jgi:hypothetical protein
MSGSTNQIKLYSKDECIKQEATQIKLYSKDECDLLGGNWYPNGECLKKTGGSYSWDNRQVKPAHYTVRVTLPDATHEYKTVSAVTVTDQAGNVLLNLPLPTNAGETTTELQEK